MNSFTHKVTFLISTDLTAGPHAAPTLIFIILSLFFSLCFLEASAMAHSFPSMWFSFLLHHASWCHCSLFPPWTWCFSVMLLCCIFLLFFLPAPLLIPPSSSGQCLAASLLSLVLWQARAFSPHTICPMLCQHSTGACEVPLTHPGL